MSSWAGNETRAQKAQTTNVSQWRILTLGAIKSLNSLLLNLEGREEEGKNQGKGSVAEEEKEGVRKKQGTSIQSRSISNCTNPSGEAICLVSPKAKGQCPSIKPNTKPPNIAAKTLRSLLAWSRHSFFKPVASTGLQGSQYSHSKNWLELIVPKITLQIIQESKKGNNFTQSKQHDICQVD